MPGGLASLRTLVTISRLVWPAGDDVLGAIMAAEDDLITAHRQHIEECMSAVREEMNLLANLDGSSGGGELVLARLPPCLPCWFQACQ